RRRRRRPPFGGVPNFAAPSLQFDRNRNAREQGEQRTSALRLTRARSTTEDAQMGGVYRFPALAGSAFALALSCPPSSALADAVSDAKAAVAKYSGPQTTWEGPTQGPKPEPGKKIVFLSGDEQNDISHLYGVYIKEAADKLGWSVTVIDGKGSPTSWLAGMNQ